MVTVEHVAHNIIILEPAGRLTAETVDVFTQTVARRLDAGYYNLILDLQNVNYLDSAGLGALAYAYTSSWRRGGRLVFVNVFGKNKELLRITKLLTVFEVYETTLEAERSFASPPETPAKDSDNLTRRARPETARGATGY